MQQQKSVIVSYEAHESVIARLERRGATIGQSHCIKVGKRARIFYSVPDEEAQAGGDPWGDLEAEGEAYTLLYWTANPSGPGLSRYGTIIDNAPSRDAVVKLFRFLMNGPLSTLEQCRKTTLADAATYRSVRYFDCSTL